MQTAASILTDSMNCTGISCACVYPAGACLKNLHILQMCKQVLLSLAPLSNLQADLFIFKGSYGC